MFLKNFQKFKRDLFGNSQEKQKEYTGADPGGAPLKLEKISFFGVKSWFFTRNTPTIFSSPSAGRNFLKWAP